MNINKNDYVILNGKKYYAMGGVNVGPEDDEQPKPPIYNESDYYDEINNPNGVQYLSSHNNIRDVYKQKQAVNPGKQPPHGHNLFMDLRNTKNDGEEMSPREEALNGRKIIYKWLNEESKKDPELAQLIEERGIDLEKYNNDTNNPDAFDENKNTYTIKNGHRIYKIDFDDDNSNKITKLFEDYNNGIFDYDNSTLNKSEISNKIFSGPQVIKGLRGLYYENKPFSKAVKSERAIIDNAIKNNFGTDVVQAYRAEYKNGSGNKLYTLYTSDGNRRDILLTKDGKVFGVKYDGKTTKDGTTGRIKEFVPLTEGHINHISNYNGNIKPLGVIGNSTGFKTRSVTENACGGKTSRRLYASGGSMEAPMPLGPQEDYNAINAGGSHEMNPQGGVPYGVNQDGSQNMVEEGEVSVGNNIFSDRTAMSPELCQQLGLPEGTSPAQAMQQIEALYEQGQIGDEEFQEIQQIIFEDQEAQKQNGGEQMPVEGISPEMVQGGGMPPEMMQGSQMPQQVQNEGIQPEMVQGYGFGGYR